ncbi:MAG: peptidase M14 [Acidobacteria bacterium]|nr:peptidase M14 [Acidobacteriota bacterium]
MRVFLTSRAARRMSALLITSVLVVGCHVASQEIPAPRPEALGATWDAERVDLPIPPLLTHALLEPQLARLVRESQGLITTEVLGTSVEGRAIHHLTIGRGPNAVLLWSQMHGDEPTATSALIDVLQWLVTHRSEPVPARILDTLTLHVVPMLNPDGAERFQRRNAQGIDINRDALHLQTPEGRLLKALRDKVEPVLGFNLHNQNWRTSVGTPPQPAVISLLAVAYDEARSADARRQLTKRVSSVIVEALQPFAAGRIGRYDDSFEVRAFGDNITKWGTGVVLIETGPWPGPDPDRMLVRLNFVALVTALDAVASNRVSQADPDVYETLPENGGSLLHTLVKGGTVLAGTGVPPFLADVGLAGTRVVRQQATGRTLHWQGSIQDVGDLRVYGALETIDATGLFVSPAYSDAPDGSDVLLPEPRADGKGPRIALGAPARLWILRSGGTPGRYTLVRTVELR